MPKEHIANQAIRDAMTLADEIVSELREDLGARVGMSEVNRRTLRMNIRQAAEGNMDALVRIIKMASEQETHGMMEPCPVCAEIDSVMNE